MEAALDLVKHHLYITEAVDGKKQKRLAKAEVLINNVTSSESTLEEILDKVVERMTSKFRKISTCKEVDTSEESSD